ncbi:MAG TPA: hypothetical protein VNA18_07275 [Nitrososphaeraceae archaeon]|nr:hypothetical protein [Nitrososphaeraceae archaeon]
MKFFVHYPQTGIISRAEIHLDMDGDKSLNDVKIMLLKLRSLLIQDAQHGRCFSYPPCETKSYKK